MTLVDLPDDEELLPGQTISIADLVCSRRLAIVYDPEEIIGSQLRFNLWLKCSDDDCMGKAECLPAALRHQVFYSQSEYGYMFVLLQPNGTYQTLRVFTRPLGYHSTLRPRSNFFRAHI